jgi:hypothetical protein
MNQLHFLLPLPLAEYKLLRFGFGFGFGFGLGLGQRWEFKVQNKPLSHLLGLQYLWNKASISQLSLVIFIFIFYFLDVPEDCDLV